MRKKPCDRTPNPVFAMGLADVWFCDQCRTYGEATFDPDETVKGAVERIRSAHNKLSPHCIAGTRLIRLVNLETLKAKGLIA